MNWLICKINDRIMLVRSPLTQKFIFPSDCEHQKDFLCSIDIDGSNRNIWLCYNKSHKDMEAQWFNFGEIYSAQKMMHHDVLRVLPYLAYRIQDFETKKGICGDNVQK